MRRMTRNPLRLLDCKEEGCRAVMKDAPQIVDWLDEECKAHFMELIEYLDEVGVLYVLNPHLVRGWITTREPCLCGARSGRQCSRGAQSALAAGGRYDGLVEMMGGARTRRRWDLPSGLSAPFWR